MARFLTGLAALWVIIWGLLMVIAFALPGTTLGRGAYVAIPVLLLGPPVLLLIAAALFVRRH